MINTYGENNNPCALCTDKLNSESTNVKKDYLEFSLDGKGTTLLIREDSVQELNVPEVPETVPENVDIIPSTTFIENTSSTFPLEERWSLEKDLPTKADVRVNFESHTPQSRHAAFHALYTKKWSGNTYYEEEIRNVRLKEYLKELYIAESNRRALKQLQKELEKDRRRELKENRGPEWWQEPSRKQICLVTTLGDVIKADHEEGVTGRTRQWLLDLGVTAKVTPKQVKSCMRQCLLDPVDFLLELHSVILRSQLSNNKRDPKIPFSLNERLLLSAVCVLHLPVLLTMLHFILPRPKPFSKVKQNKEALFGNLEDDTIRYSTPYMEPLPFRKQIRIQSWARHRVLMALLPSLLLDTVGNRRNSLDTLGRAISSMVLQTTDARRKIPDKLNEAPLSSISIAKMISRSVSMRKDSSKSIKSWETNSSFNRRISVQTSQVKHNRTLHAKSLDDGSERLVMGHRFAAIGDTVGSFDRSVHDNASRNNINVINQKESNLIPGSVSKQMVPMISEDKYDKEKSTFGPDSISKYSGAVVSEEGRVTLQFPSEQKEFKELQGLRDVCEEIKQLPKEKQLQRALSILSSLGDPLAQLPKIHKLPTIHRWLEIRRGKKRILSKDEKERLLKKSRALWNTALKSFHYTKGPKLDIPKREERSLTWDRKNWLSSQIKREVGNYSSRLKQEKVENARQFLPVMMTHYDQGSKLNRTFRDVYYTYFPTREADTHVYRPWQPNETRNSKSM